MSAIKIMDYRPEHQSYFESLNRAWIEKYYVMEERDEQVLTQPEEMLINHGGSILMATYDGIIAGTVGLQKTDHHTYEFIKMAVDERFRRKGIAEALSYASFLKARELGAEMIILYSNSRQVAAIALYKKLGFKHLPVGDAGYKRADVKMMMTIEEAAQAADRLYSAIHS